MRINDISTPTNLQSVTSIPLSAVKLEIHGDLLFAIRPYSMDVYDLSSDPTNPTFYGSYTPVSSPAGLFDVDVDYDRVYVAYGVDGLHIADLSQNSLPDVGQLESFGWVSEVARVGDYVYLLDLYHDLHVLDVTTPADPVKLARYNHVSPFTHMTIDGSDAFLFGGPSRKFEIVDITDPISPSFRSNYFSPAGWIEDVILDGDYAYALNGDYDLNSLEIVDISDRDNPVFITSIGQSCMSGEDFLIAGDYAFVSELSACSWISSNLTVADISNPDNPQIVATQPVSYEAGSLAHINDHLYMGNYGVRVFDITNPTIPTPAGRFTVTGAADFGYEVDAVDGLLYVTANDGDLKVVVDVTNPTAPVEVGTFEYVKGLALSDIHHHTYTYVPSQFDGLLIYGAPPGDQRIYLPFITK